MVTSRSRRPRVVCHMAASVDGRIVVDGWPASVAAAVRREYELVHAGYEADAWICGRVTMEPFAGGVRSEAEVAREHAGAARDDFLAPGEHDSFAFAIDASGRLAWETNDIDGDHVVAILSERVSDDYLAFLRERGVSYLLAGTRDIDLPPPTWTTLRELEHFHAVDDALAWARGRRIVRRQPELLERSGVRMLVIPGDPLHPDPGGDDAPVETRFVRIDGRWRAERSGPS